MEKPLKRRARREAVLSRLCKEITPAQRKLFGIFWGSKIDCIPPSFDLSYGIYTQTRYGYRASGRLPK